MTRDYYIKKYLDLGTEYLNIDLSCIVPKLVNEMLNNFENRTCKNCKWKRDEVCVNDKSLLCYADFISDGFGCNKWEQNVHPKN